MLEGTRLLQAWSKRHVATSVRFRWRARAAWLVCQAYEVPWLLSDLRGVCTPAEGHQAGIPQADDLSMAEVVTQLSLGTHRILCGVVDTRVQQGEFQHSVSKTSALQHDVFLSPVPARQGDGGGIGVAAMGFSCVGGFDQPRRKLCAVGDQTEGGREGSFFVRAWRGTGGFVPGGVGGVGVRGAVGGQVVFGRREEEAEVGVVWCLVRWVLWRGLCWLWVFV